MPPIHSKCCMLMTKRRPCIYICASSSLENRKHLHLGFAAQPWRRGRLCVLKSSVGFYKYSEEMDWKHPCCRIPRRSEIRRVPTILHPQRVAQRVCKAEKECNFFACKIAFPLLLVREVRPIDLFYLAHFATTS